MKTELWVCPNCSETIDSGFVVCWKCGTDQKGNEDPAFPSQAEDDEITAPDNHPHRRGWQFSISTLLIAVSCVAILLGAFRVFPAITKLALYGGIVGNILGLVLALFVTYVLRIPNDGSLYGRDKGNEETEGR